MARKLNETEERAFLNALARKAAVTRQAESEVPLRYRGAKEKLSLPIEEELAAWLFDEQSKRFPF